MHKIIIIFATISLLCLQASCQQKRNITNAPKEENNFDIKDFDVDGLGYKYIVTHDNEIQKYDRAGALLFRFSVNTLGDISYIDVTNPQKIAVYYQNFQTVLFLDNTLSEIKSVQLENFALWNIYALAISPDNNIWIYDPVNVKLIKINDQGKQLISSNELFEFNLPTDNTLRLLSNQNYVVLYNKAKVYIFDVFGTHIKTELLQNETIRLDENNLIYAVDNSINVRPISTTFLLEDEIIFTQDAPIKDFKILKNGDIYIYDNTGLRLGQLNK